MSRLISRDPFARTELHKTVVYSKGESRDECDWCGCGNHAYALYRFHTESDGGRKDIHSGLFCSVGCFHSMWG